MINIIFSTLNSFDYKTLSTPQHQWVSQSHYGILSIQKQTLTIFHTDTQLAETYTFEELCAMDIMGGEDHCVIDIRVIGGAIFINSHIVVVDYETCETSMEKSRQPYAIFDGKYKVESYQHMPTVRETVELFLWKYAGRMYFINSTDFETLDYYHGGIIKRDRTVVVEIKSDAPRFNYDNVEIKSAKGNIIQSLRNNTYQIKVSKDDVLYLMNEDIWHPEFKLATFNLTTID